MNNKESVKNKRSWAKEWSSNELNFSLKLVASACMHGLFFCTINLLQQWFKSRAVGDSNASYNHEIIDIVDKMIIDQVRVILVVFDKSNVFLIKTEI